jgi:hypothetical protein
MTLKEFFKTNPNITKRDMAIALDIDVAAIFGYVNGREPKLSTALAIEGFTNGKVKICDLVGVNDEAKRVPKSNRKRSV